MANMEARELPNDFDGIISGACDAKDGLRQRSVTPGDDGGDLQRHRPRLERVQGAGGKLLIYHGWADPIVTPQLRVDYYEAVEKKIGGREATQGFLRLFMIPGFDHCGWQPGPGITELAPGPNRD